MNPTVRTLALVAGALALPSCGMFAPQNKSLAQVDDLVNCIERVHVDAELAKQATDLAMSGLQTMTSADFHGDAVLAHAELVRAIESAEKQAKDLRFSVECMKRAADPVFSRWSRDIQAMQSPEIKQRSQSRFDETKTRYDAIVAAVDPTIAGYDAFNRTIKDHALFLGHDFNPGAVATITGEVQKLSGSSRELTAGFDRCLQAARAYVDQAALPMRVEAARPAPR